MHKTKTIAVIDVASVSAVSSIKADIATNWNNIALDIQSEGEAGAPTTAAAQAALLLLHYRKMAPQSQA